MSKLDTIVRLCGFKTNKKKERIDGLMEMEGNVSSLELKDKNVVLLLSAWKWLV